MVCVQEKMVRTEESRMDIVVVGAGLGGLGATIALLLAGHNVTVLESTSEIGEVGAGIQVLPNSCKVLKHWGLESLLLPYATCPKRVNILGWKGNTISSLDLHESAAKYPGTAYWDFHRANLHSCLITRTKQLGGKLQTNSRVIDLKCSPDGVTATAILQDGRCITANLIVGADGINSRLREIMLGKEAGGDPPTTTGDLAYRLLLSTKDMMKDPELARFVTDHEVNYWLGPGKHAVNYVLRGGELFNMVLLVPDDMPTDLKTNTLEGDVVEMRKLFQDWDPGIPKLLNLCTSVQKWRLCIRTPLSSWSHPTSPTFTLLGDAAHAALPYLASGAGMSFEDGAVLGECFSRITSKTPSQKRHALSVYEKCRKERTEMVVQRGNRQQDLYHLQDGEEQRERDRRMREVPTREGEALAWRDPGLAPGLLGYDHLVDVQRRWWEGQEKAKF